MREELAKMLSTCRFCGIREGVFRYPSIDAPYAYGEGFFGLASVGGFVDGWSLVVPRVHQCSMKDLYGSPALRDFLSSVLPGITSKYGHLAAFEHGANGELSETACGTAHAHLHLVPLSISLRSDLDDSGMGWVECRSSDLRSLVGSEEYLFYCEPGALEASLDPLGYVHILKAPQSQFFRRVIAKRLGLDGVSDYKRFPMLIEAERTRRTLAALCCEESYKPCSVGS